MKLNELIIPKSATTRATKRLGRGAATGQGKTGGKGHKGQNARAGGGVRNNFEGGQMPLTRRVPKRGFFNLFRKTYEVVNLSDIARKDFEGDVSPEELRAAGLVRKTSTKVKILGDGNLSKAINIKAHAFSLSAIDKIVNAGGTIEVL